MKKRNIPFYFLFHIFFFLITGWYLEYDDDPSLGAVVLAGGEDQTDHVEQRREQRPQVGIIHFLDSLDSWQFLELFWKIGY